LDKKAKRAKTQATIIIHPEAKPSKPSVKLTAFEDPTTTNTIQINKTKIIDPFKIKIGSLKNGIYILEIYSFVFNLFTFSKNLCEEV